MNVNMKNSFSRIYNNFTRGHQRECIYNFIRPKVFRIGIRPVMTEISSYYLGLKNQFHVLNSYKIK